MVREAVDEVRRHRRDKEMNSQLYTKLTAMGEPAGQRRLLFADAMTDDTPRYRRALPNQLPPPPPLP